MKNAMAVGFVERARNLQGEPGDFFDWKGTA
jgi:hypothetical protein